MEIIKNSPIEEAIKKGSFWLKIGGMSEPELERALAKGPFLLDDNAQAMMQSIDFDTLAESIKIPVARVRLDDLGFTGGYPTTGQIFEWAPELGLEVLSGGVSPYARLHDNRQQRGDVYHIAMKPIADQNGHLRIFRVGHDEDYLGTYHLKLSGSRGDLDSYWGLENSFLFGYPQMT